MAKATEGDDEADGREEKPAKARASIWAGYGKLRPKTPRKKPKAAAATIYIILTSWGGSRLAVRYTTGNGIPMEKHPSGGSYLFFPSGMVFVRESAGEINAQIHNRLMRLQAAWKPAEDEDRVA